MRTAFSGVVLLAFALGAALQPIPAHAQTSRTWVSGSGDDTHDCSRTAPCQAFGGALSKTAAGGEINCLDSADYGAVAITKAITIDCDAGTAGIAVNQITFAAVYIVAGPSDVVVLRGLDIAGNINAFGIYFQSGLSLHVEHCRIRGSGLGIFFPVNSGNGSLVVQASTFTENAIGVEIEALFTGSIAATLDRVRITKGSGGGVKIVGNTPNSGPSAVSITDSTISQNAGNGVVAVSGTGNVTVQIARSVIASNGSSGVQSNQSSGGTSIVTLQGSQLNDNANGNVNFVGGGTLLTFGDNSLVGTQGTGFSGPISMQ